MDILRQAKTPEDIVPVDVPYTSSLLARILGDLADRYPFIEIGEAGNSVMGRRLYTIRLGQGQTEVFYNASFHANEWITTPLLLKFAEEYAKAYAAGERLYGVHTSFLYENFSLYLMPMVNPDGVDLVNGEIDGGAYYELAKRISGDYPAIPFPSGWKANINGVDLNLQFPAGWENAREIKYEQGCTSPAPRDFVGTAPLSQPESIAVYRFTTQHEFRLILAYHTQGEVIYWKYLDYNPRQAARIARYFGAVSGYEVAVTPVASGYAGYKDWFIQTYNRPGYTIEAGRGENPLPVTQFPKIYEDNKRILLGGMTQLDPEDL